MSLFRILFGAFLFFILLPTGSELHLLPSGPIIRTQEQKLLYHLMKNYEKHTRPVRNVSRAVTVEFGLTLTNIFELNEKKQILTLNVWLDHRWNDELLRWDPDRFYGIRNIKIPCDYIWLPDIFLYNNAKDQVTGLMESRAMLEHTGTVFWPPPTQIKSTCKIDITYFPFDSQKCYLKFGSWSYHGFDLDVVNMSDKIDLTNFVESGEFEIIHTHLKRRVVYYTCCLEPYPDVVFFLHVRRKTLYYMNNIVFPCMMMSALSLLVFLLPPDSGEKVALGITVLLTFSVFVLAIAEQMPETSESIPLIGIYLTTVMSLTSVSVIFTVMVLSLHYRGFQQLDVPHWMQNVFLGKLRKWLCVKASFNRNELSCDQSVLKRLSLRLHDNERRLSENMMDELSSSCPPSSPISHGSALSGSRSSVTLSALIGQMREENRRLSRLSYGSCDEIPPPKKISTTSQYLVPPGWDIPMEQENEHEQSTSVTCCKKRRRSKRASSAIEDIKGEQNELYIELLRELRRLVGRQDLEEQWKSAISQWRLIAQVIDKLLFWISLGVNTTVSMLLLIVLPIWHRSTEDNTFDEKELGLVEDIS